MEILEGQTQDAMIVHIVGHVNSSDAPELGARLNRLIDAGNRAIIIDMARLDHMTSAGVRCLLRAEKRAHEATGRLVLCSLHGLTLELFEVGGFLEMFTVARSRDEAMRKAIAP
jgi:stage II sporulation protein AA (anti-sigma F factor antagonist)